MAFVREDFFSFSSFSLWNAKMPQDDLWRKTLPLKKVCACSPWAASSGFAAASPLSETAPSPHCCSCILIHMSADTRRITYHLGCIMKLPLLNIFFLISISFISVKKCWLWVAVKTAYWGVEGRRVHQTGCFVIGEHEGTRPQTQLLQVLLEDAPGGLHEVWEFVNKHRKNMLAYVYFLY